MSAWTSYGISNVASGENDIVFRPKYPTAAKRGVLYLHGFGQSPSTYGTAAEALNAQGRANILTSLASQGHIVVASGVGGRSTWANDTALAAITVAKNYLLGLGVLPTKVALIGQSMGALNALAWASSNIASTSCVVGLIPVVNLTDLVVNNRDGYAVFANSAYSGGYSEAVYGAAHNPATMAAAGSFNALPVQFWYGSTDTVTPASVVQSVAANITGSDARQLVGGHAESTIDLVDVPSLLSFVLSSG